MFQNPTRDQVLALAGLFQSTALVHQLATRDDHDESALAASAVSVLRVDADSVNEVFGSLDDLRLGCGSLANLVGGRAGDASRAMFQYAVSMHQIALRLPSMDSVSESIHEGLSELAGRFLRADELVDDSDENLEALYESLAALYSRTISTLTPRIMVQGSEGRLSNPAVVHRVRSALFAGIRAAYLWHQLGGRRWHLLFQRRKYQAVAGRLARI